MHEDEEAVRSRLFGTASSDGMLGEGKDAASRPAAVTLANVKALDEKFK